MPNTAYKITCCIAALFVAFALTTCPAVALDDAGGFAGDSDYGSNSSSGSSSSHDYSSSRDDDDGDFSG